MLPFPRTFFLCGAALVILPSLSSCGSLAGPSAQNSPPKTVSLDPMMAGKSLAKTTFRATVLAAVRQPVTSARQGLSVLWNRPREVVVGNIPAELVPLETISQQPGTRAFEDLLDEQDFPGPVNGTLKWLVDGDGFFPEFDRQIASARKSINVQVYIFDNDDIAVRYADKLKKRSKDVDVRVLYDDFGSATAHLSSPITAPPKDFSPPPDMRAYLRDGSAVQVRMTLNPWLVADHTKLLVFDDRTAILGGMNIGREYYNEWHDLMVRVEGPAVAELASVFSKTWRKNGKFGDLALLSAPKAFRKPSPVGNGIPLRILRTEPGIGKHEIRDSILLALKGAKKRVYIENPYFANDEVVLAVRAAAMRGVDVRVILPAEGDSAIMDAGNLATARTLIEAGARLYRYPRMTHMKVMVCDGWATMGSANLDVLSMRINRELNIAFSDEAEVEKLVRTVFNPDFARSRRIRLKDTESQTSGFAEAVADQL
ncbi:phosphatidylserine/phosphatidylglycerophosphate/cardiolipin synthase family protein [Luteolibacter algae]|uniref:Phosphatidylserine/phosphatidylglycerophosphate/ cardiolipin synthase family protein n=1 Tax=Luteolibacter algae TaxID=454151 RepID=A0ABW5D4N6_9BACT